MPTGSSGVGSLQSRRQLLGMTFYISANTIGKGRAIEPADGPQYGWRDDEQRQTDRHTHTHIEWTKREDGYFCA